MLHIPKSTRRKPRTEFECHKNTRNLWRYHVFGRFDFYLKLNHPWWFFYQLYFPEFSPADQMSMQFAVGYKEFWVLMLPLVYAQGPLCFTCSMLWFGKRTLKGLHFSNLGIYKCLEFVRHRTGRAFSIRLESSVQVNGSNWCYVSDPKKVISATTYECFERPVEWTLVEKYKGYTVLCIEGSLISILQPFASIAPP